MPNKTTDGTPDAGKLACPVRNGGKGGDYFKALPIIIIGSPALYRADRLTVAGSVGGRSQLRNAD